VLGRPYRFAFLVATFVVVITQVPTPVAGQLAWFPTVVDQGPSLGTHTSLAVDGQGRAHISYLDEGNVTLKHAAQVDGGGWRIETVDRPSYVVGATSLALDAAGGPHISYVDGGHLRYASWDGGRWNVSIVDLTYSDGTDSLAIGRDGFPRIAYAWDTGILRFARWDGRAWIRETVETTTFVARYVSLTLDPIDRAYISYSGNGNLRYASEGDTGWNTEVVDPHPDTGWFSQLALDSRGWPRIAYQDHGGAALRFAAWDGFARQWIFDTIESGGDPGWDLGFALDANGSPHVSYYERLSSDLRYARKTGSDWERQTVDSIGTVGWYTSLALNRSGIPSISYYDATRDALRFASAGIAFQVRTDSPESVRTDRAILRGELMCLGAFSSANISFDWRPVGSGTWNHTASGELKDSGPQRLALANLTPNITYEYRVVGTTAQETVYGGTVQFRTTEPPPPPEPPYLLVGFTAILITAAIVIARLAWKRRLRREALRRKMTRDEMLRP
jgi:hypothetical protein